MVQLPKTTGLSIKYDDQTDFTSQKVVIDSAGSYNFDIHAVRQSFKYFAQAENLKSEVYTIEVIDRPIIKTIDLTITPPAYSRQPQVLQKDNGNIISLAGSYVDFNLTSTKELKSAKLEFTDTTVFNLSVNGTEASGKYRIKGDISYQIILTDLNGNNNQSPITYTIKSLTDAYPTIEVVKPNENTILANEQPVDMLLKITDDYGFTKLVN